MNEFYLKENILKLSQFVVYAKMRSKRMQQRLLFCDALSLNKSNKCSY
jgi:hypothetical protein